MSRLDITVFAQDKIHAMPTSVTSLFWISLCAVLAPLISGLVPRRLLPEVVLLLVSGIVIGPFVLGLAARDEAIGLLSHLGLGMLFLLAGYEVELSQLTGRDGRRAGLTWVCCLCLAFAVVTLVGLSEVIGSEVAVAIALTSTALGTLLPILKDARMLPGPVGSDVLRHGAFGELGPVVVMGLFLGSRGPLVSGGLLALFALVAVLVSLPTGWLRRDGSQLLRLVRLGSETTGQTPVRLTLLLLAALTAVAAAFRLETVLGAFAAGFILRRALPHGSGNLESKLDGIGFGFLIPVFFIASGMAIDPDVLADHTPALIVFVVMMLSLRGAPVYAATRYGRASNAPAMTHRQSLRVALYASTGLPIIVAVTALAVSSHHMTAATASTLTAAGAVTVLLFPLLATVLGPEAPPKQGP